MLLHAFPLSHLIWKGLQPPPGYRLLLPDFPGFGFSPLAPSGFTLSEAAQALEDHLIDQGIREPFILGGISMGGYWAMEYLRRYPERANGILFISTRPGVDKPEARQNRLLMADKVLNEGVEYLVAAMIPGLLGKITLSDKPEVADQIAKWIRQTHAGGIALAQRAMAQRRDQADLLPSLKARTLILAGREDGLIPATEAEAMARAIPVSRLRVLEKAGHLVPLEEPAEFQKILDEFLSAPA